MLCVCVFVAVLWSFSEQILIALHQDATASKVAGVYISIQLISLPAAAYNVTLTMILQALGQTAPGFVGTTPEALHECTKIKCRAKILFSFRLSCCQHICFCIRLHCGFSPWFILYSFSLRQGRNTNVFSIFSATCRMLCFEY